MLIFALPDIYLKAVVSVEDHRFYSHNGIDIIAIGRALVNDIITMSFAEGGSTITQQLAKNTYFTQYKKQQREFRVEEILEQKDIQLVEHLMDEERALEIHRFLHAMEEPYKEVFSLRTFGELSFEKIGQLFGKSDGWARVTYYRAKRKIVEYMEAIQDEGN